MRAAWLATTHLSLTATGYLEYDLYHATSDTSSQYVVPRSGIAAIPGAQVRLLDKGYTFTADEAEANSGPWFKRDSSDARPPLAVGRMFAATTAGKWLYTLRWRPQQGLLLQEIH